MVEDLYETLNTYEAVPVKSGIMLGPSEAEMNQIKALPS